MNYKQNPVNKSITIAFAFLTAMIGCTKNEFNSPVTEEIPALVSNSSLAANGNSAAAQIAASENLVIPTSVAVPENLPNGNSRVATYFAVGVQKYKARIKPGSDPAVLEWTFVAPQADLYNSGNALVGFHGAGPYWTISAFDSIFAQHFTPAKTAPADDAESIDWLLLMPKTGTTPTGIFADVDYIQRIATKGGKAPLTPPNSITETIDVKYKAIYRFTKKN